MWLIKTQGFMLRLRHVFRRRSWHVLGFERWLCRVVCSSRLNWRRHCRFIGTLCLWMWFHGPWQNRVSQLPLNAASLKAEKVVATRQSCKPWTRLRAAPLHPSESPLSAACSRSSSFIFSPEYVLKSFNFNTALLMHKVLGIFSLAC